MVETSNELNSVMNIFKQIEKISGKNDKVLIVMRNKENELFKYFLNFLYNETITTGLSDKKINKALSAKDWLNFEDNNPTTLKSAQEAMDFVSKNNTGSDKIISNVQGFLNRLPEEEKDFMKEVLTKSYKCGITSSSVNKAIPKLIPEYKVQLANSYAKVADKIKGDFWITQKLDGHRTLVEIHDDGRIIFRTRKGHQITGMTELEEEIRDSVLSPEGFEKGYSIVLDGEITISDESIDISKVFQETSKIIRRDGEKKGLKFHVFDAITYEEFLNGESKELYGDRRKALDNTFKEFFFPSEYIELVPVLYHGEDKDVIPELMDTATGKGWEGLILNTDTKYFCKRHNGLLKVKEFFSADVEVTGYEVGTGRLRETLGALVLDFEGYEVRLGTGFTDQDRKDIWDDKENVVGKIVQVDYFEITSNQNGGKSLRFPSFKGFRELKTKEDVNIES